MVWPCLDNARPVNPLTSIALKTSSKGGAGRRRETWQRTIKRELRQGDLNLEDMNARTQDRNAWKEFVADLWTT